MDPKAIRETHDGDGRFIPAGGESRDAELARLRAENARLREALVATVDLAQDRCTTLRDAGLRMAAEVCQDAVDDARALLHAEGGSDGESTK